MTSNEIAALMVAELDKANKKNGPFTSAHHGYAVLLEEVDELWDEIGGRKASSNGHATRMKKKVMQYGLP